MDSEPTEKAFYEEPQSTFLYRDTRNGEYEEVNAWYAEFTTHHVVFRDHAGNIKHAVLARFVDELTQQVVA